MTLTDTRLIEVEFPLKQVSLDSVHEKNVRHGHISTLHIWPARRPLAACRAALGATLLPDPGEAMERKEIYRRLAGEVVNTVKSDRPGVRTVEQHRYETRGGILHWGRESSLDLEWFRSKIREAHGGRAPRVLDPFAGGGAIPIEAMRLGCEATAADINPVAWLLLRCTLEYPQRFAEETLPLPDFVRSDTRFMEAFLKAHGLKGKALARRLNALNPVDSDSAEPPLVGLNNEFNLQADLAWQLRAWGRHVLERVRTTLAKRYPTYAEFQPLVADGTPFKQQPPKLLTPDAKGLTNAEPLNAHFNAAWLKDPRNPRWVVKPTVAYLWARTVRCKGCRAMLPLLKTRWLCRKDDKRVLLSMQPKADGVDFNIEMEVPQVGGNAAQRRIHDKKIGAGTMSRSGARCPCCSSVMTMEDIRLEGRAGNLGSVMTAVVVDGPKGKEYRLPETEELHTSYVARKELSELYEQTPFGLPTEPLPGKEALGFRIPLYGFDRWAKLFADRQLLTLGTFVREIRNCTESMQGVPEEWRKAMVACLALSIGRLADRGSSLATWTN